MQVGDASGAAAGGDDDVLDESLFDELVAALLVVVSARLEVGNDVAERNGGAAGTRAQTAGEALAVHQLHVPVAAGGRPLGAAHELVAAAQTNGGLVLDRGAVLQVAWRNVLEYAILQYSIYYSMYM